MTYSRSACGGLMRKAAVILATGALFVAIGASNPAAASRADSAAPADSRAAVTNALVRSAQVTHESYCVKFSGQCVDPEPNIAPAGEYVGHDEPSVEFRSTKP